MPILNYTTKIAPEKTVAEIQQILARAKATAILSEYDEQGRVARLSFRVKTAGGGGEMAFCLPANVEGVLAVMKKDPKLPRSAKTPEQAARVAWRILKDWVEAQMAIVESGQAALAEVFLPYAQVTPEGETLYHLVQRQGLPLALGYNGGEAKGQRHEQ